MALRTSLVAQPHLYMGDTTGRPLDAGKVYFGQPNKDPEFYPINVFYDEALTIAAPQPIRTMGGFMNANGQMVEVYAAETSYSVKVLDGYGRQVFYQEDMSSTSTSSSVSTRLPYPDAVERSLSDKMSDSISAKDFGAKGDGITDDTAALSSAFNSGKAIHLTDGDYLYTHITVNSPVKITGNGRLKYSGLSDADSTTIRFKSSVDADSLQILSSGGGDLIYNLAVFEAADVKIKYLNVQADSQRSLRGGVEFFEGNINIGYAKFKNVARPLAFTKDADDDTWRSNVTIGKLEADTYLRGLKLRKLNNVNIGVIDIKGQWSGAVMTAGYNGILIESIKDSKIGDAYIADSTEHAFRFGCPEGSENVTINSIVTKDSLGCGLKINPQGANIVKQIVIGSVTAINAGRGVGSGSCEVVRLTRAHNIEIGTVNGLIYCTRVLYLADVKDLRINSVYGENIQARFIEFEQSIDDAFEDCENITIEGGIGKCTTNARSAISANYTGARKLKNINITASVTGYQRSAVALNDSNIESSNINITITPTDAAILFEGVTSGVKTRSSNGLGEYIGNANAVSINGELTLTASTFSASTYDNKAPIFLRSSEITAGDGKIGGAIIFGRIGSTRRGAAIAVKQTGVDMAAAQGIAFYTQSAATSATDAIRETMVLAHTGTMILPLLPTSAAGLSAGSMWREGNTIKIV